MIDSAINKDHRGASVNLAQHIGSNGLIAYGIGASLSKLDFDIGATAKSSK
ncbi:hypothetical protein [Campylobacter devanensis]|uniref:hypothetical protein n=1 Tax=Campylobacter devanensis TaxID=3161138 RepID=UPI0015C50B3E|nr:MULTISPECIES: hypothetical protein [unclassified Campylobacter]